jgi:hypothetical protein
MSTHLQRYAPSGGFHPDIFVYALGGLVGAVLLAGLYELLLHLNPILFASFLLTMGFGFGLGWMGIFLIQRGHCRNRRLAFVLALVIAGGGLAASYGWGYRRALSQMADHSPGTTVLQLAQDVSVETWLETRITNGWGIRRSAITGKGVLTIWALEALFVLSLAVLITVSTASDPYCEHCQQWTGRQDAFITGHTREYAQRLLDRGGLAALLALPDRTADDTSTRLQLVRHFCPRCSLTAFLTVKEIRAAERGGHGKEETATLLENVELSPELNAAYVQRFTSQQRASLAAGSPE